MGFLDFRPARGGRARLGAFPARKRFAATGKARRGGGKYTRSKTRTKTGSTVMFQKRRPTTLGNSLIRNISGSLTNSSCSYFHKPSRTVALMEKVGAPQQYTNASGVRYDGKFGFQMPFTAGSVCPGSDLELLQGFVQTVSPGAVGSVATRPTQYILESCLLNCTMANASVAPVELTIYDLVLRRDLPAKFNLPTVTGGTGTTITAIGNPSSVWEAGSFWQNGNINQASSPLATIAVGASPYDAQLWKDYFKVYKKQRVMLSAGGIHRHTVSQKLNKIVDTSLLKVSNFSNVADVGLPFAGYAGWTRYVMVVAKGFPVSDSSAAANVTTSDPHIDVVNDIRYKYTMCYNNVSATSNLDTLTTPEACQIVLTHNAQVAPVIATV